MAQIVSVKMSKFDNQPWGFRLQGGVDFAAPLTVQKVNGDSLAEKAGLRVGDALLRINETDIYQLRHKEAQDAVSRAGNNFELVVSRGGGMPKTAVKTNDYVPTPVQAQPAIQPIQQKDGGNVKLVNRQFNSPMNLYSEENIAETLSSQAEVLAQGVLGVNFKKNEKNYDPCNSEVFKMLQELERAPREPEPERSVHFAPMSPPVKQHPVSAPSFPANNIGSSANQITPPAGGVRIFPAGPAPSQQPSTLIGLKPFASQQTKVEETVEQITITTEITESTVTQETTIQTNDLPKETPTYSPAPSAVKPVSFMPSQPVSRPAGIGSVGAASAALAAGSPAPKGAGSGIQSAPRRGKGVLSAQSAPGARIPVCNSCNNQIRGKFVTALGFTWCPDHFVCTMQQCRRQLQDIGFVEEAKQLYCEGCFETFLAPTCARCSKTVKGDCLNAIGKQFHPECFACTYCGRLFGNSHFYLEDGLPYCEADWNELFTTKCYACGYPIEAGDRWVEAMNNNYHSQCFTCAVCKKNLEGQSFLGKNGRPMCKSHAR